AGAWAPPPLSPEDVAVPRPARLPRLCAALSVCLLALAAAPPPKVELSPAQREDLVKQRDRLQREVSVLLKAGKVPGATAAAEQWMAALRRLGEPEQRAVDLLNSLANNHPGRENFPAARAAPQAGLAMQTKPAAPA